MDALKYLRIERHGGVAVVTLDRPPLNVLNLRMQDELAAAAERIARDTTVAAVVIYGGSRCFAAGADIAEMSAMGIEDLTARPRRLQHGFDEIAALQVPTVAAITGYALGGGCELALCADFRFVAEDAVFGQPEIQLGVIPGCGGTQRLPRLVGLSRAKELILTGRHVDANESLRIGLADRVLDSASVLSEAIDWAAQFEAGPRVALGAAKWAINRGFGAALEDGLAIERDAFDTVFASDDRSVGMTHFHTKAPGTPQFRGR